MYVGQIQEGNESEETEERHRLGSATTSPSAASTTTHTNANTEPIVIHHHQRTPLHQPAGRNTTTKSRRSDVDVDSRGVSCTNCRPTSREKTSVVVVPVDPKHSHSHSFSFSSTPGSVHGGGLFKSLISGIARRSPKPSPLPESSSSSVADREEQWRIAVAELSHKLVQANRRRDEAILESSKLKYSMAELEKKLNRLEAYCHNLKSGLEICVYTKTNNNNRTPPTPARNSFHIKVDNHELIVNNFLVSVSDARSSIRYLSRSLTSQLKLMGIKVFERLSAVLRSYDIKISSSSTNNQRSVQLYLEALLNSAFFEDFESAGFSKSGVNRILNPVERSETYYADFNALKELQWEEVLDKGTKHFSEEFSGFCDRKMSEIVAMLGWNRAWPEQLLQAFFGASKSVWLVYLLANSVHPTLNIFRVDKGAQFNPVYMDDMGGDKTKKLLPTVVRIMVTPGFYVYDNVVKCKVLCRYYNSSSGSNNSNYSVFSTSTNVEDIKRSPLSLP